MSGRSYTTSITKVIKALALSSLLILHPGRGIAPSTLELEEVGGLDKIAIGNWETDVYRKHHDAKLPLVAMRAMPGHDQRRRYLKHVCSVFYGNATHAQLPNLLFPWLDETMEKVRNIDNHIAFSFLALLKILRWVALQYAAVMIQHYNRTHYIYKEFDELFESDAFNKYA